MVLMVGWSWLFVVRHGDRMGKAGLMTKVDRSYRKRVCGDYTGRHAVHAERLSVGPTHSLGRISKARKERMQPTPGQLTQ